MPSLNRIGMQVAKARAAQPVMVWVHPVRRPRHHTP
jgi:hypothetical protein